MKHGGVRGWADISPLTSYYKYLHTHSHTLLKQAEGLLHSLDKSSPFVVPTPPEALIKSLAPASRSELHSLLRHPSTAYSRGQEARRGVSGWMPTQGLRRQGSKPPGGFVSWTSLSPRGVLIARPAASRSQAVLPRRHRASGFGTAARPA